ncbi:Translation initiation factor IF3-2, chloroplastic [Glycine max]|nr:Translation initiation factor IF3-2, chloroplastic [Glycine max]
MSAVGGFTLTLSPINLKLPLLPSNRLFNRTPFKSSISFSLRSNDEQQPLGLDIAALRSASVRLIDGNQIMVGVVSKTLARQMAQDSELDLVIVSPDADPPVVRMMDYNKYKYEQQKKKKGQQKRSAELRSWSTESLLVMKANARGETRMKAMERAMEENHEVVESRLTSIEGMIQRLAAAWEKKSPAANMNTVDASKGHEGTAAHDSNWWRNLELPIFDGEDPMGWLIKIERYFRLRAVREGSGDDCNGGGSFGLVSGFELRKSFSSVVGTAIRDSARIHRYNIDQHDYSVRLKAAQKFLKDGDKVKVIVNLKGRETEFRNIAIELIKRFQSDVGELATEETKSFRDRNMSIVMVPKKAALQKAQEPPKRKDMSAADEVSAGVQHN